MPLQNIKIAIAGAKGRMGQQLLQAMAGEKDLQLATIISRSNLDFQSSYPHIECVSDYRVAKSVADVLIDFTRPAATLAHLDICVARGTALLIGTTGFGEEAIKSIKEAAKIIPILLAPNTSIGINLLMGIIQYLCPQLIKHSDLDVEIIESHHNKKVDAPSGTALALGEAVAKSMGFNLKDVAETQRANKTSARKKQEIGFSAVRAGNIIGEHELMFALGDEIISLKHSALNRVIFARGALFAARWLASQKPGRLFNMQDAVAL